LLLYSSYLPLGVPNWPVIYFINLVASEATSHKTLFVALKRTIGEGLNLVDPLACDGTNTGRRRYKIPSASALKRSNLLGHGKLPFGMALSIPIRSRLEGNRKTIVTRRVAIRWTTAASRKKRGHLIRGRRHIGRRGGGRNIRNMRAPRIVERKRRQYRGGWRVRREKRRTRWEEGGSGEGGSSARTGCGGGSGGTEGGVLGNNRKDMSSTEKAEEEGRGVEGTRLIKLDVTGNAHPMANGVPTPISLVLITVAKKHTLNRLSDQFGLLARGQKNIANATKRAKSQIIRGASKQML
jgi:hypothetical protein